MSNDASHFASSGGLGRSSVARQDSALKSFADIIEDFRECLPVEERDVLGKYVSGTAMIQDLRAQLKKSKEGSRLLWCTSNIAKFADTWSPYFKIIDIFVSSHPEYSAIAWGAIRFIFQMCTNYRGFFERLAEMFREIEIALPRYGLLYDRIKARMRPGIDNPLNMEVDGARILESLSFVYFDVIQFCHEACRLLLRKRGGFQKRMKAVWRTAWTPFDVRFQELLKRLAMHKEAFTEEVHMYQISISTSILDQLHRDRTERSENSTNFLDKYCDSIRAEMKAVLGRPADNSTQDRSEMAASESKVKELQAWISAPQELDIDKRKRQFASGSGTLFLDSTPIISWMQPFRAAMSAPEMVATASFPINFQAEDVPTHPIAAVEGKTVIVLGAPGYGKTTLSITLIDKLREANEWLPKHQKHLICFFHFDRMASKIQCGLAFRAFLSQAVHHGREDKELVDALSIMMRGATHTMASDSAIEGALQIALQVFTEPFIVVDGVDECSDLSEFFELLQQTSAFPKCNIAIFSRPDAKVSLNIRDSASIVRLDRNFNSGDMKQYLRPHIQNLISRQLLPASMSVNEVVSALCGRSEGLFLWAKLMVRFLQLECLTPRSREAAIGDLRSFKDLDDLFQAIVSRIQSQDHYQVDMSKKSFQFLLTARRPLSVLELQHLLAIRPGEPTCPQLDYIADFEHSLVAACGALVDIEDDTVRFVHTSAVDFLGSYCDGGHSNKSNTPWISRVEANLVFGTQLLSYVSYDVPTKPLGGSSNTQADAALVRKKFPLLEYASTFWVDHLSASISAWSAEPHLLDGRALRDIHKLLSVFTTNKDIVNTWIEASWTFNTPPLLHSVSNQLDALVGQMTSSMRMRQPLRQLSDEIRQFSKDLQVLDNDWGKALSRSPNEIWEPNIPMFLDTAFFGTKKVGSVTWLGGEKMNGQAKKESGEPQAIFLGSATSSHGEMAGILSIVPSRKYMANLDKLSGLNGSDLSDQHIRSVLRDRILEYAEGWKIRYQIWSLGEGKPVIADFYIAPPLDEIVLTLYHSIVKDEPGELKVQVTFGPGLDELLIMRTFFKIHPAPAPPLPRTLARFPTYKYTSQTICPQFIPRMTEVCARNGWLPFGHKGVYHCLEDNVLHRGLFSQSGTFIAVLLGSGMPVDKVLEKTNFTFFNCRLAIYHRLNTGSHKYPNIKRVAMTDTFGRWGNVSTLFVLHPTEPVAILTGVGKTYLWSFWEEGEPLVELHNSSLDDIAISTDGQWLIGIETIVSYSWDDQQPVEEATKAPTRIALSKYLDPPSAGTTAVESQNLSGLREEGLSSDLLSISEKRRELVLALGPSRGVLSSSQTVATFHGDQFQTVQVKSRLEDSSIMLQARQFDGSMSVAGIARLPTPVMSHIHHHRVDMLPALPNDESLKMVMHPAQGGNTCCSSGRSPQSRLRRPMLIRCDVLTVQVEEKKVLESQDGMSVDWSAYYLQQPPEARYSTFRAQNV